jgi:hypothetical protein
VPTRSLTFYFGIVLQNACVTDYFTLDSAKADFQQVIYDADQGNGDAFGKTHVGATSVTQSNSADCSANVVYSLEIFNPTSKTWVDYNGLTSAAKTSNYPYVQNYNSATAEFDVLFSSDLGSTYGGTSVNMRIKTSDPISRANAGTIFDPFTITFVYQRLCDDDELSITIANDLQTQFYTFAGSDLVKAPTIT